VGGLCACVPEIPLGCATAAPPTCAPDDCPDGFTCADVGGLACACVLDDVVSCLLAAAPACNADCPDGTTCTDIGGACLCQETPAFEACPAQPRTGCHVPAPPSQGHTRSGSFSVRASGTPSLTWKWTRGDEVAPGDLGDPIAGTTSYTLCVYDETAGAAAFQARLDVPAGGTCGGKPCWQAKPGKLKYRDPAAAASGVRAIDLKAGSVGKSKAKLKAKGAGMPVLALPFDQQDEVIVQLVTSEGVCWESRYPTPARRSDGERFKDLDDVP
jgi:hypothetical protein